MILQLLVILMTARLLSGLLRHLGQPPVIGEMAAGFVLGPLLLGWFWPELHQQLFATEQLREINGLGQLGLVAFMFLVGAELRLRPSSTTARNHRLGAWWDASCLAVLGILLPFLAGLVLAPLLFAQLAPAGVGFWPFALFVATALSITALPVMARIIKERDLQSSAAGQLALAAAAIGDLLAWLLLAVVIAIGRPSADAGQSLGNAGWLILLAIGLFGVLRPALTQALRRRQAAISPALIALLLIGALACSWATEQLQVHAALGAFLFGLCLPREPRLLAALQGIEPLVLLVLMPCFFVSAGLNTGADVFAGGGGLMLLLLFGAAVAGKLLAGLVGARLAGQPWRSAWMVAALMNTRGVVELVVLKVGLDAGLIGNQMFTLLFLTAIGTTLMTSPLLGLLSRPAAFAAYGRDARRDSL
jgi:Kef-type K+ transport system membrane component KefB